MRDFKKYNIWKESHLLTLKIYEITTTFPDNEKFGLVSQIRRAMSSVPTNISEGCGRDSDIEFKRFLTIAQGSICEVEYLVILSKDLNYLDYQISKELLNSISQIRRQIHSLKQKLTS